MMRYIYSIVGVLFLVALGITDSTINSSDILLGYIVLLSAFMIADEIGELRKELKKTGVKGGTD